LIINLNCYICIRDSIYKRACLEVGSHKTKTMKKLITMIIAGTFGVLVFAPSEVEAQPVSDRAVIPVAVTLNQVLRLNITNGGNIEFVFNQIDQYTNGINSGGGVAGASAFYNTEFDIASSTRWELDMGAEDANFIGVDDPVNTLNLNNVGFQLVTTGAHTVGAELLDPATAFAGVIALPAFAVTVIGGSAVAGNSNAGDETDNAFRIEWRAGTAEGTMNATALIDQVPSPEPDRYVTNVLLDLEQF